MDKPLFIYVGGLPGSGKTLLTEKVLEEYKGNDFEIIDPDDYRFYHPDINNILKNPYTAIDKTIEFTYEIEMYLLLNCIKNKKNIISIGTLRSTKYISNFIDTYLSDYVVGLKVMNVSIKEARKASLERFKTQLLTGEFPRYVSDNYLNNAYVGLNNTLNEFKNNDKISFIDIYERGENKDYPVKIKRHK